MKILAATDLHGDRRLAKRLAAKAKKYNVDLVILCGDLTFAEQDLEGLIGPFKQRKKRVLLIPGNHETVATIDFLVSLYSPGIYNLHGYSVRFEDIAFFGCGSGNIGLFQLSDEEIKELLLKAHSRIKDARKKVLVTHIPPLDTKLDNLGWTLAGSAGVREVIEETQPNLVLCGHLHETFGRIDRIGRSKIVNVGRKGRIIRI
jgi:hypothetical protein